MRLKVSIEQHNNATGYQTVGTGKDLILVHGWGTHSAIWQDVVIQLSQSYCVHLVNLPGIDDEPLIGEYSLPLIAEAILEKVPSNAIWCGWSLGGLIASYIACEFPERVEKLIQVCTALKFVEEADWLGVKTEVFDTFSAGLNKQPEKTLNRFLSLQAMGSETVKSDITNIKRLLKGDKSYHQSALLGGLTLLSHTDLRDKFKHLKVPCLSIFGAYDSLVPIDNAELIKSINSNICSLIFEKSSHAPFISEVECFCEVLKDFIEA